MGKCNALESRPDCTNPSRSRNILETQPNLQPGLCMLQTPSNAEAQLMNVALEDVGINSGMNLGGDWNMDGYLYS